MDSDRDVIVRGRPSYPYDYYMCLDSNGNLESYGHFVGSRNALLARGLATEETEFPTRPRGCIARQAPEQDSGGSFYREKVSMLADGRYRISLDGTLAARRDRLFRRFMAAALEKPKKLQRKRLGGPK